MGQWISAGNSRNAGRQKDTGQPDVAFGLVTCCSEGCNSLWGDLGKERSCHFPEISFGLQNKKDREAQ